jgi:hypothetical protein
MNASPALSFPSRKNLINLNLNCGVVSSILAPRGFLNGAWRLSR